MSHQLTELCETDPTIDRKSPWNIFFRRERGGLVVKNTGRKQMALLSPFKNKNACKNGEKSISAGPLGAYPHAP